jgi:hypothetical protein
MVRANPKDLNRQGSGFGSPERSGGVIQIHAFNANNQVDDKSCEQVAWGKFLGCVDKEAKSELAE